MNKEIKYFPVEQFVPYIAKLSGGVDIKIDPDEIDKVDRAIASGNFVKVRQGLINPSFLIGIVIDEDRVKWAEEFQEGIIEHNRVNSLPGDFEDQYGKKFHVERKKLIEFKGIPSLGDIFNESNKVKKLT